MTQSAYTNATINNMLGWLKAFAVWVLKLFNLGGEGGSPLEWLAKNWLQLLVIIAVAGLIVDWLIWMVRWRPYWVWFRKKRIIIEDDDFFSEGPPVTTRSRRSGGQKDRRSTASAAKDRRKGDEDNGDFVVASTVVRRTRPASRANAAERADLQERKDRREDVKLRTGSFRRKVHSAFIVEETEEETPQERLARKPARPDPASAEKIGRGSPLQEDAVFNISDLPVSDEPEEFES